MIDISRRRGCTQFGSIMPAALAVLSTVFVGAMPPVVSAQAIEDCIESPNSPPPQGSHWYYRTDRVNQRKCWYLGPQGKKTQTIAADAQQTANSRAPQEEETAGFAAQVQTQERLTQTGEATGGGRTQAGFAAQVQTQEPLMQIGQATDAGPTQKGASAVRWPDPPHSIDAAARNAAATASSFQEHSTIAGQEADTAGRLPAPAPETAMTTAAAPTLAPVSVLLQVLALVAGALALTGILLRALLKIALLRFRQPFDDQIEIELRNSQDVDLPTSQEESIPPNFASSFPRRRVTSEHVELDDDFEELLRRLRERGRRAA
jgi:hypothetical protein